MSEAEKFQVKTVEEYLHQPEEYRNAVRKIVRSHAINELYGSETFNEPAISMAPTPYAKWLTCRVAMEEFGHHVRFAELGREIGIPPDELVPQLGGKRTLTIFDFEMRAWTDYCVLKLLGEPAEMMQLEDLLYCSFHPLRRIARMTMPEERFHAKFGQDMCADLVEKEGIGDRLQDAIDRLYPNTLAFFGRPGSTNNATYRKWGIKIRTNENMRDQYKGHVKQLVEDKLGLALPAVTQEVL